MKSRPRVRTPAAARSCGPRHTRTADDGDGRPPRGGALARAPQLVRARADVPHARWHEGTPAEEPVKIRQGQPKRQRLCASDSAHSSLGVSRFDRSCRERDTAHARLCGRVCRFVSTCAEAVGAMKCSPRHGKPSHSQRGRHDDEGAATVTYDLHGWISKGERPAFGRTTPNPRALLCVSLCASALVGNLCARKSTAAHICKSSAEVDGREQPRLCVHGVTAAMTVTAAVWETTVAWRRRYGGAVARRRWQQRRR